MTQTSIYLSIGALEMVEKYFRGNNSLSSAVSSAINRYVSDGCPHPFYGRASRSTRENFKRIRVSILEKTEASLPVGINLSFSIDEYLKRTFL